MYDVTPCHGHENHPLNEECEFCKQVKDRSEAEFCGTYYRTGIKTTRGLFGCTETCDLHRFTWVEGDDFRENGGHACRDCIERARVISVDERDGLGMDKCSNKY